MSSNTVNLDEQRHFITEVRETLDSGIQRAATLALAFDVYTPGRFFRPTEIYGGIRTFGAPIDDAEKQNLAEREPIVNWATYWMAVDMFDDWFKVIEVGNEKDDTLDVKCQNTLDELEAKKHLTRLIYFDRVYGWSILLLAYTGFDDEDWETPVYNVSDLGVKTTLKGDRSILQIYPYAGRQTKVQVDEKDEDEGSLRFGHPSIYSIYRTDDAASGTKVNWTRVIHNAPRLKEHCYEGLSIIDGIYDDAHGYRNLRWAVYQTMWRYGSGFPHFKHPKATQQQIDAAIADGKYNNFLARSYFVSGALGDDVEFKGVQGVNLNPTPYFNIAFTNLAMGSRLPEDILKGVSAGRITGSEVNERQKAATLSSEQLMVEPTVTELLKRLMDTGQIDHDYDENPFKIEWNPTFKMNERDQARIEFWRERSNTERTNYMKLDEVRDYNKLGPLDEDGDVVLGILKNQPAAPFMGGGDTMPPLGDEEDSDK